MAEETTDRSERTEEPTQRRLDEAREKGQVASSREINHAVMILAATIMALFMAPAAVRDTVATLTPFLAQPDLIVLDAGALQSFSLAAASAVALNFIGPLIFVTLMAFAAGFLQTGPLFATEQIKPSAEKISPLAGMKRLFSAKAVAEFAKGIVKLSVVGAVGVLVLWPMVDEIESLVMISPAAAMDQIHRHSLKLLGSVLAIVAAIAVLDYAFQRFSTLKSLRMSRQELKDEYKQTEGDPMIRARLKQIRIERARRRMMQAVPEADVVVTNPTHYAVALKYDMLNMNAPKVVAKGADHVALRIRAVATEAGVPIVENPPLARALHGAVDLDQEIAPEHYKAVAEVIGYIMRLRRGRNGAPLPGAGRGTR